MELIPYNQFAKQAEELILERIVELQKEIQPFLDIRSDRKLDRYEYPRYKNLRDTIATNRSILHSLSCNPEYLMQ